ncbi:uncharacterized protein LOC111302515 [Durio zibethinus]|uniref:Uncharacterized protein LOC111302515 n=1 Tax=Durio zibethinus TaxID=66656 RepID=A0A6P5ZMJ4_DURZI|nr:uncharacterized protein LOC111302515 [Durio zibethinus]
MAYNLREHINTRLRNKFWQTNLPNNIKIFGWRLNHGVLPVFSNLRKRNIDVQPWHRKFCQTNLPNKIKIFGWRLNHGLLPVFSNLRKRHIDVQLEVDKENFELGLVVAVWHSRNLVVRAGEQRNPEATAQFATNYLEEFKKAQDISLNNKTEMEDRWQAPPIGVVTTNFDGAINVEENMGGIGVVPRDDKGSAVEVAKEMGFYSILLERDAVEIIHCLKSSTDDLSVVGNLMEDA